MSSHRFPDLLIIGAGITGLATAWQLLQRQRDLRITFIEKEAEIAQHASGRNSGVLHAGFYYSSDSLKARLCRQGNLALQEFCQAHALRLQRCGKLVVTRSAEELPRLRRLYEQGLRNGVPLQLISEDEARELEPQVRTVEQALYSPSTATVDPVEVCHFLRRELQQRGVHFELNTAYVRRRGRCVHTTRGVYEAQHTLNAAGLYADKIARDYGYAQHMTLLPFKGLYLAYTGNAQVLTRHIYPVPNPKQPFLGVHYTRTVHDKLKIGPTAIPAFWREHYQGLERFRINELAEVLWYEGHLFARNAFGFRELALQEMRKYWRPYFARQAAHLASGVNLKQLKKPVQPGIRAQLLDTRSLELIQDFVVQGDAQSTHVLNAVSPAFTCSLAFGDLLAERILSPDAVGV